MAHQRVPEPNNKKDFKNQPMTVLADNTFLKGCYMVKYLTTGGMGIIYTAEKAGQKYIVKEVNSKYPRLVISITQEKATLERLNHPHIVKAVELFEEEGFYYLVLNYIEGTTLDKLVPEDPAEFLEEEQIVQWGIKLCGIFEYLHQQTPPVIYRDLKPSNVILSPDNEVNLIDFGIARIYKEEKNIDTDLLGTATTASPEHYGGGQTDARSDVYTIGATLHYLLTNGRYLSEPFFFPPIRNINPEVSLQTERTLAKAVEYEPSNRFQTALQMKEALEGKVMLDEQGNATSPKEELRYEKPLHEKLPPKEIILEKIKQPEGDPTLALEKQPKPKPINKHNVLLVGGIIGLILIILFAGLLSKKIPTSIEYKSKNRTINIVLTSTPATRPNITSPTPAHTQTISPAPTTPTVSPSAAQPTATETPVPVTTNPAPTPTFDKEKESLRKIALQKRKERLLALQKEKIRIAEQKRKERLLALEKLRIAEQKKEKERLRKIALQKEKERLAKQNQKGYVTYNGPAGSRASVGGRTLSPGSGTSLLPGSYTATITKASGEKSSVMVIVRPGKTSRISQ